MSTRRKPRKRPAPDCPHTVDGYDPPPRGADPDMDRVADFILRRDPDGSTFAALLRETWDQLYDGQRTGRWRPEDLHKTEKTHMGTLVEINVQRALEFPDGDAMDYKIDGIEVDCKFSNRLGGWMIPSEAYRHGHLCLVVWADEYRKRWEAGLVRATPRSAGLAPDEPDDLLGAENQDRKRSLTPEGESRIRWLYPRPVLPENLLLHIDDDVRDRIFAPPGMRKPSGQAKINMLFRLVQHRIVNRGSVFTVAQQQDSQKRARDARRHEHLGCEGILVLGHQESDPVIATNLELPVPRKGDFVSARVVPAEPDFSGPQTEIDGSQWRLAQDDDPVVPAPPVERVARKA